MSDPRQQPKIIDEDGVPVVDAAGSRSGTDPLGGPDGAGGPSPFGLPGFTVLDPSGRFMTADGTRLSLRKILGWRGMAVLAVVVALLVALAIVSVVAAAIVVPVLLLVAMISAGLARLRRGGRSSTVAVRR